MTGRPGVRADQRGRALVVSVLVAVVAALGLTGCGTSPSGPAPLTSVPGTGGAAPAGLDPSGSTSTPVSTATAVAVQTTMKQFAPLDAAGNLTAPAQPGGNGSCFATSITVPLSGVYRCLSGNTIVDPCFAPAHEASPATVVCFADPWSAGTILTLTRALPAYAPDLTEGNPWAVELSTGARCIAVTGTVAALGDVDLSYSCDDGSLAGLTIDSNGAMSAHYGPPAGPLQTAGVLVAWRGRSYRLAG